MTATTTTWRHLIIPPKRTPTSFSINWAAAVKVSTRPDVYRFTLRGALFCTAVLVTSSSLKFWFLTHFCCCCRSKSLIWSIFQFLSGFFFQSQAIPLQNHWDWFLCLSVRFNGVSMATTGLKISLSEAISGWHVNSPILFLIFDSSAFKEYLNPTARLHLVFLSHSLCVSLCQRKNCLWSSEKRRHVKSAPLSGAERLYLFSRACLNTLVICLPGEDCGRKWCRLL